MSKSKFKFKLNQEGVRELMRSSEMQKVLKEYSGIVQKQMGEEFEIYVAGTRAVIGSKSKKGDKQAMKNNKLLKSLGGSKKQ